MTKQIEALSDNNILIILLIIISITCFSCSNKVRPYLNNICYFDTTSVIEQEMVLALEGNVNNHYGLTYDGFDQYFRLTPSFVILNTKDFMSSYNIGLLTFPLSNSYYVNNDTSKTNYYSFTALTEAFDQDTTKDIFIDFKDKYFDKKVKDYFKRCKIKHIKSAIFRYSLYRIKAKIKFNGYSEIILPDLSKTSYLVERKICKIYYIYDVRSIERLNNW